MLKDNFNIDKVINDGAYQGWSFGPMLLNNGQPMTSFNSSVARKNPRSSIGYYEPRHYCFITVDGRGQSGSSDMTLRELSALFFKLGCKVAFNLNGDGSAKMMFMNEIVNNPNSRNRLISDILYLTENEGS